MIKASHLSVIKYPRQFKSPRCRSLSLLIYIYTGSQCVPSQLTGLISASDWLITPPTMTRPP